MCLVDVLLKLKFWETSLYMLWN